MGASDKSILSDINWSEINHLLQERCSNLEAGLEEPLGLGELVADLQEHHGEKIDAQVITYWRKVGILQPVRGAKGRRRVWRYPADQVRRAHLAAILMYEKHGLSPAGTAGAVSAWFARDLTTTAEFAVDIAEVSRAQLLLVARCLGVIASLATGRKSPPPDSILVCREMPDESSVRVQQGGFRVVGYSPQQVRGFLAPTEMLVGFTTPGPQPEVLVRLDKLGDMESRLGGREYVGIEVCLSDEGPFGELVVGLRKGTTDRGAQSLLSALAAKELSVSLGSTQRQLLERLLEYVFEVVIGFREVLFSADPRHSVPRNADLLSVLLAAVLLAAPDRWDYAAFVAPTDEGDVLETVACTSTYPLDARGRVRPLDPGRSLESWVIENREPIVVERLADLGVDPVRRMEEPAREFAIIPGLAGRDIRGALYVGASGVPSSGESVFSSSDVSLLRLMASVIAEAHTRRQLSSITPLIKLIPRPDVPRQGETELRTALQSLLVDEVGPAFARQDPNRVLADEYMVLMMVRVVGISNPNALSWFTTKIGRRMHDFITSHDEPTAVSDKFSPFVYRLGNERLVGMLSRVHGEAREVKDPLSSQLEPLTSLIDGAKILVLRLYYNYDWLGRDLLVGNTVDVARVERWIGYLIRGAKRTLKAAEYLTGAGDAMARGQFERAATLLEEARRIDPDNAYILRHLAQVYNRLHEFQRAIERGKEAVDADKRDRREFPGSHLTLAEAYLGAGQYRNGLEELRTAVALSETPLYVQPYVEALLRYGTGDERQNAIALVDRVLSSAQPVGVDRAWLFALKGELLEKLDRAEEALEALDMAVTHDPHNRALLRMLHRLQDDVLVIGSAVGSDT